MDERDTILTKSRISRRSLLGQAGVLLLAAVAGPALAFKGLAAKWNSKMEIVVSLTIATIEDRRVHRPYVAVWIEDAQGKMVRTLAVWVQQTGKGSKWYPDLKRWYRGAMSLKESANIDLLTTVSSATKSAGSYKLIWDGKDDKKALVDQGKYYVCIEAAREHGTYQLIRQVVTVGSQAFSTDVKGNVEISSARVEYRKKA